MSSRQGAAMIWTPMGIGCSGTGTATTGNPMNEIGWVWMPIGVQIIAAPWREDIALRVAFALEKMGAVSAPSPRGI